MLVGARRLARLSRYDLHAVCSWGRDIDVHSLWPFCWLWRCGAPVFAWFQVRPDALDNLRPRHTSESDEEMQSTSKADPTLPKQPSWRKAPSRAVHLQCHSLLLVGPLGRMEQLE